MHISKHFSKALFIGALILLFFALMSRLDYVVNSTLYDYGLKFSYGWAAPYWMIYDSIFIIFSLILGFTYWFASNKNRTDLKICVALIATVNLLMIGGLQDLMFFILWAGGLPPEHIIWWWAPLISVAGKWNSTTQVLFTGLMADASALVWALAFWNQNEDSKYPRLFSSLKTEDEKSKRLG